MVKISKILCLAVFGLFLCSNAEAQIYQYNGSIIFANKDTLKAQIKAGEHVQNKSKVTYKTSASGTKYLSAGPDKVLAYYHNKDYYRAIEVHGERIFLRVNLVGYVKFYETIDEDTNLYFYLKKADGEIQQIPKANFRAFLSNYLGDCNNEALVRELSKVRYTRFRIANVISIYNACRFPDKYVPAKYNAQTHVKFKVLAGLNYVNLNFPFTSTFGEEVSSENFAFNGGINLVFEGERRVGSGLEVVYTSFKFDLDFEDILQANVLAGETIRKYKASHTSISYFLRYQLAEDGDAFLRFGPSIALFSIESDEAVQNEIINVDNPIMFGLLIGLDIQASNKVNILFDYRRVSGGGVFSLQDNTRSSSASLGISYKLN